MAKMKMRTPHGGFDYVGERRGYWARLSNGVGAEVTLTEYPRSLLGLLEAGVLVGAAKDDAEALKKQLST